MRKQILKTGQVMLSALKVEKQKAEKCLISLRNLLLIVDKTWCTFRQEVFTLTKLGRQVPDLPCSVVFEECEWKALYCFVHQTTELPEKEPTLQETIHMVASLGGFLGRKSDGQPGSITLWRGLIRLNDIAATRLIFSTHLPTPQALMGKG